MRKQSGYSWLIGCGVLLVAAVILQSGLLAYAMYVLIGVLLVSRLLARDWITSLEATRLTHITEPAEVGDSIEVRIGLKNKGKLPVPWVLAEDLLPQPALSARPPKLKLKGRRLKLAMLRPGGSTVLKYTIRCETRGYFQIGPLILEAGDLFGLHRRHRIDTEPQYLMVFPKVLPLPDYDLASRRPIGDVRMQHRLYEDPTRIAGVRPYQLGDPLQRIHWRATARTGALHSKVYEPTSLAGASLLLDFHAAGYPQRGEPYRSDLAVTVAASIAYAVAVMGQQVGLACNGRDAADRLRGGMKHLAKLPADERAFRTREAARKQVEVMDDDERMRPLVVPTRRGSEQFQRIRETLARVELTEGLTFPALTLEMAPRLPKDATIIAVLPEVSVESSLALGNLRRQGFAITVLLIGMNDDLLEKAYGRLMAENIRDIRHLANEGALANFGGSGVDRSQPYDVVTELA